MSRSEASGERGFTLIEVLAAVLIVCLVFGLLLEAVTRNLHNLSQARQETRAAQIAGDRVRELQTLLESGEKLEDGVREEPCPAAEELVCQTIVAAQTLALPADYPGDLPPSPLFSRANEPPRAAQPGQPPPDPPLRLIQVRAYPPETDPNTVDPFVVLLVAPLDAQAQALLQQQQGQEQQQQQQPQGEGGQVPGNEASQAPRSRGTR